MDRTSLARKRRQEAHQPAKPPIRNLRDRRLQEVAQRRPLSDKVRVSNNDGGVGSPPTRDGGQESPKVEDGANARHFTVTNVGSGGTLYLKPSRLVPSSSLQRPPATPPRNTEGKGSLYTKWSGVRKSSASGTRPSRVQARRSSALEMAGPVPPLSMANVHPRRRQTRSHSFSTIHDAVRSPTLDSGDFQVLLHGEDASQPQQRPKSSVDFSADLLNLRIPHYRLGTPQFSERGTAYLHNSVYTPTSEDVGSFVFSRQDVDRPFAAPPERGAASVRSPYPQPSSSKPSRSSRPALPPKDSFPIAPSIYDKIEANVNAPSIIRYCFTTARILAATPARIVYQITSPLFLDYELLADFFLTFRCFMSCRDLLGHLVARMKWALQNDNDVGRIVRVRTFVALRHWILNYFADDFLHDFEFRQRFCDNVNALLKSLQRQPDRGSGDVNIIGELKKCWRRTCAQIWPIPDALDTSPDVDIVPGGEKPLPEFPGSETSLLPPMQHQRPRMDFRRSSQITLPFLEAERRSEEGLSEQQQPRQPYGVAPSLQRLRTASIPSSPMSEESIHVLSCSVPFLRHLKFAPHVKARSSKERRGGAQQRPPLSGTRARGTHKRSGSFSDALRDRRAPLPSGQAENGNIQSLPAVALTGSLVRGLLLQPSPSKLDDLLPMSPAAETNEPKAGALDPNAGMKKVMGGMRRALSGRKVPSGSLTPSPRSTNSSDSVGLGQNIMQEWRLGASHQRPTPNRVDILGEKVEGSYKDAVEDAETVENDLSNPPDVSAPPNGGEIHSNELQPVDDLQKPPRLDRLNSNITSGSRSIVIFDDTGTSEMSPTSGRFSSWASAVTPQPLYLDPNILIDEAELQDYGDLDAFDELRPSGTMGEQPVCNGSAMSDAWDTRHADDERGSVVPNEHARRSISEPPSALDSPPIRRQLRRRPGGNLKAADNVHDLEPAPRPSGDSFATFSRSMITSEPRTHELSGTHFSGQEYSALRLPASVTSSRKGDSVTLLPTHSSQQNLRPSFANQVSELADIPDGSSEGGIEDALAKLEGKSARPRNRWSTMAHIRRRSEKPLLKSQRSPSELIKTTEGSPQAEYLPSVTGVLSPRTETQGASVHNRSASIASSESRIGSHSEPPSEPFLVTGQHEEERFLPMRSSAQQDGMPSQGAERTASSQGPPRTPESPDNLERRFKSPAKSPASQGSFLLDDNESLSDISTEIADQSGDESLGVRSFFFDDTVDDMYMHRQPFQSPSTPPSTVEAPQDQSPEGRFGPRPLIIDDRQLRLKEAASAPKLFSSAKQSFEFQSRPSELRRTRTSPSKRLDSHLPFILAFESELIAEQLTIIEKDALDEVDWKDLISLNWQQTPLKVQNWVDFLKEDNSNGIDVVIARFNLVVKWVVSECVLTEALNERAKTITKFIHIAKHALSLRNYASMYQITLALLSSDLARLPKTWALVPPAEKDMLDRFAKLCQPLRNFQALRAEMESASTEDGCIPFVGLYTHDLTFNAQKPARIDPPPPAKEALVNFERYQTAATIVKSLLRLMEASEKYVFDVHPEVLSRCLWLAALDDTEIIARSRVLEREIL